ncbi:metallophosphoesterase (TIGR00282 family) [Desulfohalotomaculum tongense]|uniref:TIGR00282 family metallophosphoesterase n=1 Tax=Desulforadius tongensis TaxID=1216062 RepID=UPI00195AD96F|nr:TIGR00282 family metallophosphoesterase [Desulforadius tongensis]MBM7854479.1 metallophosphoesterase (TIGR00282 family) [Desulforadius tongensis]
MRVLMIGDIVGKAGRRAVKECLPSLKGDLGLDFVIANGENAAGGKGITKAIAKELFSFGVDMLTMGNHVWNQKEIFAYLPKEPRIIRPANYPPGTPGNGYNIYGVNDLKIAVINLAGRVYMPEVDCPFRKVDELIKEIEHRADIILVDFHAEATSEKVAMGWHLDGRVTAVVGTHTHVQTADERILPEGTAYITDLGMSGPRNSVIGVKTDVILRKFKTGLPQKFEVANTDYQFNAVVISIDETTGKAVEIQRIFNLE